MQSQNNPNLFSNNLHVELLIKRNEMLEYLKISRDKFEEVSEIIDDKLYIFGILSCSQDSCSLVSDKELVNTLRKERQKWKSRIRGRKVRAHRRSNRMIDVNVSVDEETHFKMMMYKKNNKLSSNDKAIKKIFGDS